MLESYRLLTYINERLSTMAKKYYSIHIGDNNDLLIKATKPFEYVDTIIGNKGDRLEFRISIPNTGSRTYSFEEANEYSQLLSGCAEINCLIETFHERKRYEKYKKFDKEMCDEIIEWFLKTSYAKDMENCLNGIDEYHLNPYHQERSILDHALMVSSEAIKHWRDEKEFYILFLAGLVHDIGKIRARSVEMRNSSGEMMCIFRNHENIGLTFAADVLLSFIQTDMAEKIGYSWADLKRTLLLVPYHDIYKYTHKEAEMMYRDYTRLIAMFSVCDTRGRLIDEPRNIDEHIKYISNGDTNLGNRMNKYLYNIDFLIGVPASGKSTYSEIHKRNHNYRYIISRDDIIERLGWYLSINNKEAIRSKYNLPTTILKQLKDISSRFTSYGDRFKELTDKDLQKWIDHIFMYRYHMAIMNNDGNILIDKTNLNKKSRRQLLNVFTKSPYGNANDIKKNLSLFNKRAIIMAEGYASIIDRNEKRAFNYY